VEKPDERIYRHALEKLNVRPEEAVFVDDVPANINAAQALGLHGVLFKTTQQTLGELQQILLTDDQ
jgi:putative hydrolase of the HAD superfamily